MKFFESSQGERSIHFPSCFQKQGESIVSALRETTGGHRCQTFGIVIILERIVNHQGDGFVKSSRCKARKNRGVKRTCKVRCNDEVEAQRRRWTFYGTIKG
jgi:hypothetical protein